MSYFDISNGCVSCSSFSPVSDMSMNNLTQLDNNTNYLANMVATGVMNNSNNTVNGGSVGQYPNQGGQQLSTQNMSNHFTNSGGNNNAGNNNNKNSMNNSGAGMSTNLNQLPNARPSAKNVAMKKQMVNNKYKYENELEDDGMNSNDTGMASGANFYLMLGIVFLCALSMHETVKFYINQSIKLNDGNPALYAGYTVVAVLVAFALYNYLTKP